MRRARELTRDRIVWQAASLLLTYPDAEHDARLDTVAQLCARLPDDRARPLRETLECLRAQPMTANATRYVDTFDMRRHSTLLLTYWTDGDTRNRGTAMLVFADSYRGAGATPPKSEAPDHLTVVLEFAALVDPAVGAQLLARHRTAIEAIQLALVEFGSPYAPVLAAVAATLPTVTAEQRTLARTLVAAGPPAESVGLAPFTLTVPPRHSIHATEQAGAR